MGRFFTLLLLCLSLVSCDKNADDSQNAPAGGVLIRIRNAGLVPLEGIRVVASETQDYGPLGANQLTGYKPFSKAYRYAYIRVVANGQELVLQPIDYVGETPLQPGRYTYALSVVDGVSGRYLTLDFKPD